MQTVTPSVVQDIGLLWMHEVRSVLRYLVEESGPVVVDDLDRQVMAGFRASYETERGLRQRTLELMLRLQLRPDNPAFPMNVSTYNYMRPQMLAPVFLKLARQERDELAATRARYEGASSLEERLFRYLLDDCVKAREESIARIEKILGIGSAAPAKVPAEAAPAVETKEETSAAAPAKEGPVWHNENLSLEERMALVKGMGVFEQLFAAMAQTDCTACGYDCEGYARAIADGEEKDLTKCAPGELETQNMLEKVMGKRS